MMEFKIKCKISRKQIPKLGLISTPNRDDIRYLDHHAYVPVYCNNNPKNGVLKYDIYIFSKGYWTPAGSMTENYYETKVKQYTKEDPNL